MRVINTGLHEGITDIDAALRNTKDTISDLRKELQ